MSKSSNFLRVPTALAALLVPAMHALAAQPPAVAPPTELPRLIRITDDVYTIENANPDLAELRAFGGNVTVYLTDEGVVLVDAKREAMHDDIVAKVKTLTDKPIKYLILTHNHGDHAGGASALAALGTTVIISRDGRDNMVRANQDWLPEVTYSDRADLFLGGKEIQLHETMGHTRGDTVVYLPQAKVVAVGDLAHNPPGIPLQVNYPDGGSWTEWVNALDRIATLDFEYLVQGHGRVLTRPEVVALRDRIFSIRERVRVLTRQGRSAEEIAATLRSEFGWPAEGQLGNVPLMMEELR